jgi:hypothetical protein
VKLKSTAVLAAFIAGIVMAAPVAASVTMPPGAITIPSSGTFLYMNSQAGDYIGGGAEQLYTRADTDIVGSLPPGSNYFRGRAIQGDYVHWWYLDISAPAGQALAVGSYTGAVRASSGQPGLQGLSLYGDGRGCNVVTGQFDITELSFDPTGGELLRFAARFEQHCEGGTPALFGQIRIENEPPTPGVSLPVGSIAVPTSGSFLYLTGQPRDYILGGREQLYTSADSQFNTSDFQRGGEYFIGQVVQGSYEHWWTVQIAAPAGVPLATGSYIRAFRAPFRPAGSPGLDVGGDGRGCNEVTGKFDVDELSFWPAGELHVFQATFEQHCEGFTPALFGRIRIEAAQPPPPLTWSLSVRDDSSVSKKTSQVTVQGDVSCSRDVPVTLTGTLTQVVANRATISGSFSTQVNCVAPTTRWYATLSGDNGRFGSGSATVSVQATACEAKCSSASVTRPIKLNSSK